MSDRTAFALIGLAPVVLGLHHLIWPAAWAVPDGDEDAPRDPAGRLIPRPVWKVRLIGVGIIAFGLAWLYIVLFMKPADAPALI